MSDIDRAFALIQGIQSSNPKLYEALRLLIQKIADLEADEVRLRRKIEERAELLPAPSNFAYELKFRSIGLSWSAVPLAANYELRIGADWDTAVYITTVANLNVELEPKLAGTYTFLLKTINAESEESEAFSTLIVEVPSIPALSLSATVVDNNVLLDWDEPDHPFEIIEYRVYRNGDFVGYVDASFFVIFEQVGGTFVYKVIAVDYAGNESSDAEISVDVNQPPDYVLESSYVSTLGYTKVNCYVEGSNLVAIVDPSRTWAQHFTDNSWTTIQQQIDAGFPIYAEPSVNSGSYEETHDFGIFFTNTIVALTYNKNVIDGAITDTIELSYSDNGITWTGPFTATSLFIPSFKHIKFKFTFAGTGGNDIAEYSRITINVQIKQVMDSGRIEALSTDTLGTEVEFNIPFKDVNSITLTVEGTTVPYIAIFDFDDIPNPVSFFIYVYDKDGNRVTQFVDWKVRGVL